MFPGAGARVFYNDAGEPLGWDYPSYDEPEWDDRADTAADYAAEEAYEYAEDEDPDGDPDAFVAFRLNHHELTVEQAYETWTDSRSERDGG